MADNPKQRGRQHLKNKAKFKNRSKVPQPSTPKTPNLGSNWDTYSEIRDDVHTTSRLSSGENFSILADAPISKGSHFQFKADAGDEFFLGNAASDTSGLFNLDLNLLALSIASVPFHERCSIPDSYFTPSQQHFMKQSAKNSAELYKQSLMKLGYTIDGIKEEEIFSHKEYLGNSVQQYTEIDSHKEPNKLPSGATGGSIINENCRDQLKTGFERICPLQIEKLNELEEEFDRVTLTKQDLKSLDDELLKGCSGDESIFINYGNDSKETTDTKASSLLETESLEEWLDDVLED